MNRCSLCTNISNNEDIKAVEVTLKRKNKPARVVITLSKLILRLSNSNFKCKNYFQVKGCAMGTKCAPTHVNIFIAIFEENNIYRLIQEKCKLYLKYMDDIFLI